MNTQEIRALIKDEMKKNCKNCLLVRKALNRKLPDIEECHLCPIHVLSNKVIEALE